MANQYRPAVNRFFLVHATYGIKALESLPILQRLLHQSLTEKNQGETEETVSNPEGGQLAPRHQDRWYS